MKSPLRYRPFVLFLAAFLGLATQTTATCTYADAFHATELENGNLLSWSTLKEVNNQTFAIQKSLDGFEFVTEGIIRGANNSDEVRQYRYLDLAVGEAKVFYRLVDIDKEGFYNISETIIMTRHRENNLLVTAMSETKTDRYFTMTIVSGVDGALDYNILDTQNRIVKNGSTEMVKGQNILSMDLQDLQSGKYRVAVLNQEEREEVFILKEDGTDQPKQNFALKNEQEQKQDKN